MKCDLGGAPASYPGAMSEDKCICVCVCDITLLYLYGGGRRGPRDRASRDIRAVLSRPSLDRDMSERTRRNHRMSRIAEIRWE